MRGDVKISHSTPQQLGWLRRPELDTPGIEVWQVSDHGHLVRRTTDQAVADAAQVLSWEIPGGTA